MAKRTRAQFSGDLAEVQVFAHLLQTGAAINSLTGSDTGWDLHLHIPDTIVDVGSSKAWTLSGHTAHIQVKFRSKPHSIRVSIDTVKGWVSASRQGTPTFVFLLDEEERLHYITPCDLNALLNSRPNAPDGTQIDLRSVTRHLYQLDHFKRVLHFWRTYPQVALAGLHDSPLADGTRATCDDAILLVGDVFLGWLQRYAHMELDNRDASTWSRYTDSFTQPYLGSHRYSAADEHHFASEVEQFIVFNERSRDGLDPARYTSAQDPDSVRRDANSLLDFYFAAG